MDRVRGEIQRASVDMPSLHLPAEAEAETPARAGWLAWLRGPTLGGLAVAVVAAIALVFVLPPDEPTGADTWRGGGVMDLELVRVRMGEAQPQGTLVKAQAGDRLQLTLSAPDAGWVQIYDVQDDGVVLTWLEPRQVEAKQPLQQDVLLDDYPGAERVYILFAADPVDLPRVERAVQEAFHQPLPALDRLPGLGDGVLQRSVLLVKEGGP
jgi:hypothetical protein